MTTWRVVDKYGRKQSRITFTDIHTATHYKRIISARFPEYEWVIVKVKEGVK